MLGLAFLAAPGATAFAQGGPRIFERKVAVASADEDRLQGGGRRWATLTDDRAEALRQAALRRYAVLDTPAEAAFDRLCALARELLGVRVAVVALVDGEREWSKARLGLEVSEWPRAWAFYPHLADGVPAAGETYVFPDATLDPRFVQNPFVAGPPNLRFLAGSPLHDPDGVFLGMLAVGDPEPRPAGLSADGARHLTDLADLAVNELELRLQRRLALEAAGRAAVEAKAAQAARSVEARLRKAHEAAGAVAFEVGPGGEVLGTVRHLRGLLGLAPGTPLTRRGVAEALRPEDRPMFEAEADRVARQGGGFLLELGVAATVGNGVARWLEVRGAAEPPDGPAGRRGRILGVVLDVTARREAAERERLLARELDHRTRNALAILHASVRLTPTGDAEAFARSVEGRIAALSRVHSLLSDARWTGVELRALAASLLARRSGPTECDGPDVVLDPTAAQPIGLVLHELAHLDAGNEAAAAPRGRASLRWQLDGEALHLTWHEPGLPRAEPAGTRYGVGRRIVEACAKTQLAGTVAWTWSNAGLACNVRLPRIRTVLVADPGPREAG
jgi:two-component sensor histidine kinase